MERCERVNYDGTFMNFLHRRICSSGRWKDILAKQALPWTLRDIDLGANVLEIGPGPGLTTELLSPRVPHLTCVEIDPRYAAALGSRMHGGNVTVVHGDATAMSFADATFDGAVCLTMLHHVQSPALQDRLFSEVARVLRPGGVFVGMDSVYSTLLRLLHVFDTMVLVDPRTLPARLARAGFVDVAVDANARAFRFQARRPA
jgi:SAM-dependent methyltransferase